ncbi:MAG: hypothetical protein ACI9NT_001065 [Bacteroidia bacterium]|jgi:hypothetical protein
MQLYRILLICLALAFSGQIPAMSVTQDAAPDVALESAQESLKNLAQEKPTDAPEHPQPVWQALDFEEKAFWATAKARIVIPNRPSNAESWELTATGSIENSYELVSMQFDPATGQLIKRERLSKGRQEQRQKSWDYQDGFIVRKRRNPTDSTPYPPSEWPVSHARRVYYPDSSEDLPVTSDYLLLVLASRLATAGPGASQDVLVHTDLNFFQARLTVIPGKRVDRDYTVAGGTRVRGPRDTTAVSIKVRPEGRQEEKPDFNLLGLHGDITLYFDQTTGLPLLLHGDAPRLGTTYIHLRGMTPRRPVK